MKIFISWSGAVSYKLAEVFSDWLPQVFQSITPFFSAEDIDKGTRWSQVLTRELDTTSVGLFCVTPENLDSRWLNFEAGAISKALGEAPDTPRVMPFLFGIKKSEVQWPLADFQMTVHDKGDIWKLIQSINRVSGSEALAEPRLQRSFEVWWPHLEENLSRIGETLGEVAPLEHPSRPVSSEQILEELLELSREQSRILNSSTIQMQMPPKRSSSVPLPRGNMLELLRSWSLFADEMLGNMLWENPDISATVRMSLAGLAEDIDKVFRTLRFEAYGEREREQTRNLIQELTVGLRTRSSGDDQAQAQTSEKPAEPTQEDVPWDDGEPPF